MSLVLAPGQALYLTTGTPVANQALSMASFAIPGGSPNSSLVTATGTTPVTLAQAVYGAAPTVISSLQIFNPDTGPLAVKLTVQSGTGEPITVYDNPAVPVNGMVSYEGGGGWQLLGLGIPEELPQFAPVAANQVLAGPSSGSAALPAFRGLAAADIPSLPLTTLAPQAADTLVANATGASASPTAVALGVGLTFSGGSLQNTISIPLDYISGLKMVWNSGTSISVTSGATYIPSLGYCFANGSLLTLSGLALAASTWYHVYLYNNGGAPAIECVTTAPAAPYYGTARCKTGDTSRRYVGSVLTDASGGVINFDHASQAGRVDYKHNINDDGLYVLNNGVATTLTTFSLAGAIPVTAVRFVGYLENASTQIAYLQVPSLTGPADFPVSFARPSSRLSAEYLVENQNAAYLLSGSSSSGFNVWVQGYVFER